MRTVRRMYVSMHPLNQHTPLCIKTPLYHEQATLKNLKFCPFFYDDKKKRYHHFHVAIFQIFPSSLAETNMILACIKQRQRETDGLSFFSLFLFPPFSRFLAFSLSLLRFLAPVRVVLSRRLKGDEERGKREEEKKVRFV